MLLLRTEKYLINTKILYQVYLFSQDEERLFRLAGRKKMKEKNKWQRKNEERRKWGERKREKEKKIESLYSLWQRDKPIGFLQLIYRKHLHITH